MKANGTADNNVTGGIASLTVGDASASVGGAGATAAILMMFGHLQVAGTDILTSHRDERERESERERERVCVCH